METVMESSMSTALSHEAHINVPTLVAARLPELAPLFGTLFAVLVQDRTLSNPQMTRHLEARHRRAEEERRLRQETYASLLEELEQARRSSKKTRQKVEKRLARLKARTLEQGLRIDVLCAPQGREEEHTEHFVLHTGHILDLVPMPTEPFTVLAIKIRDGKLALTLHLAKELRNLLAQLEVEQSLPHVFRGLPQVYASLFGLAYTHQIEHDLEPGSLYYARKRDEDALCNPGLVLEACGLQAKNQRAGDTLKLQVELLKHITLTGEHGTKLFEKVPLVEEGERQAMANELPQGVRSGRWATLSIPRALWELQGKQFTQVPVSLLTSRNLYAVNLGLRLKAEEAYKQGRLEEGYALELTRLINQAGLRQPFRAEPSRDRAILATCLGDLDTLGLVTGITDEALERLEAEEVSSQLTLDFSDHAGRPVEEELHLEWEEQLELEEENIRVAPSKRQTRRRKRYRSALTCRVIHVHLYERRLQGPPPSSLASREQQSLLPSSSPG